MKNLRQIAKYSILIATALSFLLSVSLWFLGAREEGVFVGIWVPSILAFGAFVFSAWEIENE
jgi:hypothetical protein